MGLDVSKISSRIANSKAVQRIHEVATPAINKLSENPVAKKAIGLYEPTGANNSFFGLLTLMISTVIIPRVLTAKKRNPDNKEATADEVKEILFRDLQTVGIILLGLKVIDTIAGRIGSKVTGLPLTNKPYRNVFRPQEGLKFFDRLKNAALNVLDTVNPIGGMVKYSNDDLVSRYSNFDSIGQVQKLFEEIPKEGGNNQKVFKKVLKGIVESQKDLIERKKHEKAGGVAVSLKNAEALQEKLQHNLSDIQPNSWEMINDPKLDKDIATKIVDFFKDPANSLVTSGKKLGAALRTFALALEVTYLGFGLPALNQKRLEKKYLSDKDRIYQEQFHNAARGINSRTLVEKNIKPREIELFHKFIK